MTLSSSELINTTMSGIRISEFHAFPYRNYFVPIMRLYSSQHMITKWLKMCIRDRNNRHFEIKYLTVY